MIRTAQAEVDEAQGAATTAEHTRKQAAGVLAAASRAMATAGADLAGLLNEPAPAAPVAPQSASPTPRVATRETVAGTAILRLRKPQRLVFALAVSIVALGVAAVLYHFVGDGPGSVSSAAAPAASGQASGDDADAGGQPPPRALQLSGDWSGNGATCDDNPVTIKVHGSKVSMRNETASSEGAIEGADSNDALRIRWSDGIWLYAVNGKTLTMTPPAGAPMVYQRCGE